VKGIQVSVFSLLIDTAGTCGFCLAGVSINCKKKQDQGIDLFFLVPPVIFLMKRKTAGGTTQKEEMNLRDLSRHS